MRVRVSSMGSLLPGLPQTCWGPPWEISVYVRRRPTVSVFITSPFTSPFVAGVVMVATVPYPQGHTTGK